MTGVKSENVFGQTYGKTSLASTSGNIQRGVDLPTQKRYTTTFKHEYLDHAKENHETIAQTVGVHRDECTYNRVRNLNLRL